VTQAYNPYAPPSEDAQRGAGTESQAAGGIRREGDTIVVPRQGSVFPDRCVQCNQPANGYRLQRKLHWHPPWVYFMILLNVWVYVIVALIVRKKAEVAVGLCEAHRRKRKNAILLGWIGSLAMMGTCSGGIALEREAIGPVLMVLGGVGFFVFLIVGLIRARVALPKKMDDNDVWLKVGRPFADSLGSGWTQGA
jgi:hypothetical protein